MIEWWQCYPWSAEVTLLSHLSHLDQIVNSCQVNMPCAVVLGLQIRTSFSLFYIHLHVEVEGFNTHLPHFFISVMHGWSWLKLILWHWTSTHGKDWLKKNPVSLHSPGVNSFGSLENLWAKTSSVRRCFSWKCSYLCRLVRGQITCMYKKKSQAPHILLCSVWRSSFEDSLCNFSWPCGNVGMQIIMKLNFF